ncbi:MAG TPA: sigma-70 family RNA polymerase sigma factor [Thermoanaerobaculaceae bacterium]|nr:sigma-70 family RNA polymerase sigma factor [Thermoanaerobaculaceae bacterium]
MRDETADHLASDRLLASRAASGDDEAFEQIVRANHRLVVRIAGRFFRHADVVEDVAQEVFVRAYGALADYRGEVAIGHWLSRITVNACYDHLRRRRTRPEIAFSQLDRGQRDSPADAAPFEGDDASAYWRREEARLDAERILARVSVPDRVVLTLLTLEGMTVAEVAAVTGWSAANVKIRAFRARNRIRKLLLARATGRRE